MRKTLPKIDSKKLYEKIISEKMVPILTEYKPFRDMLKVISSPKIQKTAEELDKALRLEKALILDIKNTEKEKSKLTSRVLYFSDQLNSEKGSNGDLIRLNEEKKKILLANQSISNMDEKLGEVIQEKEKLNFKLLKDTLEYCYSNINKDQEKLDKTTKEIEKYRAKLHDLRIERDAFENRAASTYNFVHGLLGSKTTQAIDEDLIK